MLTQQLQQQDMWLSNTHVAGRASSATWFHPNGTISGRNDYIAVPVRWRSRASFVIGVDTSLTFSVAQAQVDHLAVSIIVRLPTTAEHCYHRRDMTAIPIFAPL